MNGTEALRLFDSTLLGATPENGRKLLLAIAIIAIVLIFSKVVRGLLSATGDGSADKVRFWLRQTTGLVSGLAVVLGIVSIWFDDPTRLTTKDAMSREILPKLDAAGIAIASATYEITGIPSISFEPEKTSVKDIDGFAVAGWPTPAVLPK